jgi:methylphosphotriester-DNA--protein-cysteine methyltransferase
VADRAAAAVPYDGPVVHVKKSTGNVFHHPACQHLLRSKEENKETFENPTQATMRGFKPCNLFYEIVSTPTAGAPDRDGR